MKVMIMAGGTGGHIFPAAAVAQEFESNSVAVRWLGSKYGMEGELVPKLGYEFCALPVTAWHGGKLRKLTAPFNLLRSLFGSLKIFRRERPDIVVGFGGYASAPGGFAAWLLKIPLILHEQNGVPGLTNKKLESKARVVLQAFPGTFKKDYEVVGNPVRQELCQFKKPSLRGVGSHKNLRVLVLGGSQGAKALNDTLPQAISECACKDSLDIWHQAGKDKAELTSIGYSESNIEATVVEFIHDMEKAYGWADIVIARSGASTVSELASVGLYSILFPYPWHKDRQQYRNAAWLSDNGAAQWVDQNNVTTEELAKKICHWHNHRKELIERSDIAWQMGVRDSAKRIVHVAEKEIEAVKK